MLHPNTDQAAPEIRNQIYELVMLNEQKSIDMIKLFYCPRELVLPQTSGYRGLTQLCRQVRQEFLPIYQTRTVYVEIDVYDVNRFVDTFYHLDDLQSLVHCRGSIEISLDREENEAHLGSSDHVDLLPLLRLLIMAPYLHARLVATTYILDGGVPEFIHDLGTLLRIPKIEKIEMRQHLLDSMQRLILTPLPPFGRGASQPKLELWLASEAMGHDLILRKRLLHDTGFAGLKAMEMSLRFSPMYYTEALRAPKYPAAIHSTL